MIYRYLTQSFHHSLTHSLTHTAVQQAVAQTVPQAVPAGSGTVGQAVVRQPQAIEQVLARHLQVVEQAVTNAVPAGSGAVGQAVARQPQVVEQVAPRQLQAVEQAVPQTVVWLSRWQHGRSMRFRWWFPQLVPAGGCAVRRRSLSQAVRWVRVMAASFYHVWLRQLQDEGPNAGLTDTEG